MSGTISALDNDGRSREGFITVTARDGMPLRFYRTQEHDKGNAAIKSFIRDEFAGDQDEWDALRRYAVEVIEDGLRDLGIRARVTSRVKSLQSLEKKLHERNLQKPYSDRDSILADQIDFVGIRIILFYPNQKSEVIQMLGRLFEYRSTRSFRRDWKPKKWQVNDKVHGEYSADHIWLRIQDTEPPTEAPMPGKYINQPFEVQLRSLLMDVWSSMSHDLQYKSYQGTLSATEHSLLDMLKGSTEKGDAEIGLLGQPEKPKLHGAGDKTLPVPRAFDEILEQHLLRDKSREEHHDEVELLITALKEAAVTAPPKVGECLVECAEQLTALRSQHLDRLELDKKPLSLNEVHKILTDHIPQHVISEVPMGNMELLLLMLQRMNASTPDKLRGFLLNRNVRGRIDEDLKSWSRHDKLLPPTISLYILKRILEELVREDMITIKDESRRFYYGDNLISAAENAWLHSNSFDPADSLLSHSLSQTLIWVYHAVDRGSNCTLQPWQIEKCARVWAAFVSTSHGCHCRGDLVAELSYLGLMPSPQELADKQACSSSLHSQVQRHEHLLDAQVSSSSLVIPPRNQCLFKFIRQLQSIDPESWNRGIGKFFSKQEGRLAELLWGDEVDGHVSSPVRISAWLAEIGEDGLLQEYLDPEWDPTATTTSGLSKMGKLVHLAITLGNEEMKKITLSIVYTVSNEPGGSECESGSSIVERIAFWLADIGEHDLLQEYLNPACDLARTARGFVMMRKLSELATKYGNEDVKEFTSSMRIPSLKQSRAAPKDKSIDGQ
ncbi:uncharacterized protein NECHADRAFT_77117 [Fusarium vanettenii 77-13-4]|uniref:RelA/SpoT domain-containing protein n=1 Tax=Fusarium vanettenii (strain ATCC MYA-4622 / CBS 123669 / FGSC 9596 / NRRL 45880 / 77-13-4) TaxID=660122 RepID=C7ZCN9_FUSV7|nr:uncharacterized protein NECHADRAFT_77117 [Fusarium vanettenii 77-13-4]EEU38293.1 hypothetical protein NECHADRAFT_77117 [Fusarium vanettenii 77-13-4]